jgi:GAF domain-containing protein
VSGEDLRAAVAAGILGSEELHTALLQSIVEAARGIFSAKASSVFLHDEATDELVFEAVAGEGAGELIGRRFPSSTGIAGWVLATRQPLVIEDVTADPRWARDAGESTGYVPKGLMAVPLLHQERALGVLNVLDRPQESKFTLAEMELLGLFANQAAVGLELLQRTRLARTIVGGQDELSVLARLAAALHMQEGPERGDALRLLEALETVLKTS